LRGSHDPEKLRELAASLKELGQLQPILLHVTAEGLTIVAGHRRYLAARLLRWETIEAKVLPKLIGDSTLTALAENVHREDLTPVEEGRVLYQLVIDQGQDVDQVAAQFGKSRAWVDGRLELCQYPKDLLDAVHAKTISLGVARELARVTDDGYRGYLLYHAVQGGATTSSARIQVEDWIRSHTPAGEAPTATAGPPPPYQGQGVGLECAGCTKLYPIGDLRPLHFCPDCLQTHFAKKAEAGRSHRDRKGS
jgi:ParB family chromosome partitioning protein